jgi:hypothetical protein
MWTDYFRLTFAYIVPLQAPWLSAFLKIYIRAFQQASDLDETVEEKLLIGDRPRQTAKFDKSLTLRDRLLQKDPEAESSVRFFFHSIYDNY